jgi:hypothetical protein
MENNRNAALKYPEDVVNYMREAQLSGRIFNEYEAGSSGSSWLRQWPT